jgi:hypothetical protein
MVGRQRPLPEQVCGRGLWIANQLCDLVQIRSGDLGTQVRLRMAIAGIEEAREGLGERARSQQHH